MAYAPGGTRRSGTSAAEPVQRSRAGLPRTNPRPGVSPTGTAPARRSTSFLAGLGVGLAIGVVAALLLAPQSGADTRRALRRRGRRLRNRSSEAWDDLRHELSRVTRGLRKRRQAEPDVADESDD